MPKGTLEDYEGDDTTQFVLQWNDWSTAENRQELYQDAWEARRGRSALAFIRAVARAQEPPTLVDLLGTDEGADIEFEPERLGLTARMPDLGSDGE